MNIANTEENYKKLRIISKEVEEYFNNKASLNVLFQGDHFKVYPQYYSDGWVIHIYQKYTPWDWHFNCSNMSLRYRYKDIHPFYRECINYLIELLNETFPPTP
jgi:hypothetical protein